MRLLAVWYQTILTYEKSDFQNAAAGILGSRGQFLLNPNKLIVFGRPVRA